MPKEKTKTVWVAGKEFLKKHASNGKIDCQVFTRNITVPNDVFDVYGRFVGDVEIRLKGGGWKNINEWLLENGYALPAFYECMDNGEITHLRALGAKAQKPRKNTWKFYANHIAALDRTLKHKKNDSYMAASDRVAPVVIPKLFRRL